MGRGVLMTIGVIAMAIEPVVSPTTDFDIVKYAMTQGGLAAVLIVVFWSYRRDTMRILTEREDRLKVMTELVAAATAALTKSADASDRMARAVENLERRAS